MSVGLKPLGPSAGAAPASRSRKDFVIVLPLPHSGDPAGQRQPDSRHQPVQAAGEGGDRQRQQTKTVRWASPARASARNTGVCNDRA